MSPQAGWPAWAAPERVERWACRPSPFPVLRRNDHAVIAALNDRHLTPEQFQTAWRFLVVPLLPTTP